MQALTCIWNSVRLTAPLDMRDPHMGQTNAATAAMAASRRAHMARVSGAGVIVWGAVADLVAQT